MKGSESKMLSAAKLRYPLQNDNISTDAEAGGDGSLSHASHRRRPCDETRTLQPRRAVTRRLPGVLNDMSRIQVGQFRVSAPLPG